MFLDNNRFIGRENRMENPLDIGGVFVAGAQHIDPGDVNFINARCCD